MKMKMTTAGLKAICLALVLFGCRGVVAQEPGTAGDRNSRVPVGFHEFEMFGEESGRGIYEEKMLALKNGSLTEIEGRVPSTDQTPRRLDDQPQHGRQRELAHDGTVGPKQQFDPLSVGDLACAVGVVERGGIPRARHSTRAYALRCVPEPSMRYARLAAVRTALSAEA